VKFPGSGHNNDDHDDHDDDKDANLTGKLLELPDPVNDLEEIVQAKPVAHVSDVRLRVFGEDEVLTALQGIAHALKERRLPGAEIRIYGSVAMICAFPGTRRVTTDVDVVVSSPVVLSIAEEVGRELRLPEEWLNDDVRVFARSTLQFIEYRLPGCENLKIYGLTPESLFSMKCFAGRDLKDIKDMTFLADKLEIHSLQEAEALFERFYPGDAMGELPMVALLEHFEGRYQ
jgi:hypothetical protein